MNMQAKIIESSVIKSNAFHLLLVTPQDIKFQCICIILKYTNPTYNIAHKNHNTIN